MSPANFHGMPEIVLQPPDVVDDWWEGGEARRALRIGLVQMDYCN